jgi:hemerythrin-like domain-containing protein
MEKINPIAEGLLKIHQVITRGLHVSIQTCDQYIGNQNIPSEDIEGFDMYVRTLKWITYAHHLTEDDIVFPFFKDKLEAPYNQIQQDHKTIARILTDMETSVSKISSEGVGRLRKILNEFKTLWQPHIKMEETHFTAGKIEPIATLQEQTRLTGQIGKHSRKHMGPVPLALAFSFYNLEGKDREVFMMPVPWIVKKVLVPIIWKTQWKPMRPFLLT